jgi:hypothetical protein
MLLTNEVAHLQQTSSWAARSRATMAERLKALTLQSTAAEFSRFLTRTPGGSAERPYAFLDAFAAICQATPPGNRGPHSGRAFWRWIAAEWSGFDRIPHLTYAACFRQGRYYWSPACMGEAARTFYDALPKSSIAVFRGQDRSAHIGLSWTTDRTVANGFARGHRGLLNPNPVVLTTTVAKRNVAFVNTEREEAEVVLFSRRQRRYVLECPCEMANC